MYVAVLFFPVLFVPSSYISIEECKYLQKTKILFFLERFAILRVFLSSSKEEFFLYLVT